MTEFISSISQKRFPLAEKVPGKALRSGVLQEILKEHPDFDKSGAIAIAELNYYRQQYIQNLLAKEVGTLTDLEHTVLSKIDQDQLITNEGNEVKSSMTSGQRWADRIASFGGSWRFIGLFGLFLLLWMAYNVVVLLNKGFDPYPFILLNLILSCLAAIQAPIIMMSQNRQEEKDRARARNDYMVNLKSELEIRLLHDKMDHLIINQQENLLEIQQIQVDMMKELMERLDRKGKAL